MSNEVIVHKSRTNYVTVDLGFDVTGDTITSEIRSEPDEAAPLIAAWVVTVTDATKGLLLLTMDNVIAAQIKASSGFMDLKRQSGAEPLAVFDQPLEVTFRGVVTQ